jgi:hypothetical protein
VVFSLQRFYYNVAYRSVAKRRLFKQRLLLGNARNIHAGNNIKMVFSVVRAAAVSGQRLGKHVSEEKEMNATIEERCFYCRRRRRKGKSRI